MQTPVTRPTGAFGGAALTVDPILQRAAASVAQNAAGALEVDTGRLAIAGCCPAALPRSAAVQLPRWKADVNEQPIRAWRDLASDWKVWLSLALCLLIATVAWLLGYD